MRAEKLPLRHLKDISLKEVSLIINQMPCYSATSVEVRAGNEEMIELRNTVEDLIPQEQMQEPQEDVEDEKKNKEVEAKEPNEDDTKVTVKDPEQPPQEIPLEDKPKDAYYNEYLIRVIKLKRRK